MKREKISEAAQSNPCVLVGTYRSANVGWIEERSLYNLPLKAGCDPSQFARFTHVVLYCSDRAPIARTCAFTRVVDSVWMGENGYRVSEKPHVALFFAGDQIKDLMKSEILGRVYRDNYVIFSLGRFEGEVLTVGALGYVHVWCDPE